MITMIVRIGLITIGTANGKTTKETGTMMDLESPRDRQQRMSRVKVLWGEAVWYAFTRMRDLIFYAGAAVVFWTLAPIVETTYFPVVSDFTVDDFKYDADGDPIISASFVKERNCEYRGSAWYVGTPRVEAYLAQFKSDIRPFGGRQTEDFYALYSRPLGRQSAGPWEIELPPRAKDKGTFFAVWRYACGFPWYTVQIVGPFIFPPRETTATK
jgi:hypothetical protein